MNIEDEARQEADKRFPHRDVFLEGGAYMTEERSRIPLRDAFVKGAAWASERTDQDPSDAARTSDE